MPHRKEIGKGAVILSRLLSDLDAFIYSRYLLPNQVQHNYLGRYNKLCTSWLWSSSPRAFPFPGAVIALPTLFKISMGWIDNMDIPCRQRHFFFSSTTYLV